MKLQNMSLIVQFLHSDLGIREAGKTVIQDILFDDIEGKSGTNTS